MADQSRAEVTPETGISVDMNAADPSKAVTRSRAGDAARAARGDEDDGKPRTKFEKKMIARMAQLSRNMTRDFNQKQAERDAEHQRQLSELQAKVERVGAERDTGPDAADTAHDMAIGALRDKLAAAYERGDSAESAKITLEISKLDAQFWARKAAAAGVTTRESAGGQRPGGTQAPPAQPQQKPQGPTRAGARFIEANGDWWGDPEYAVEEQAASTIYLNLVNNDGFDPKSDETFKEVAKRLKRKFPNLDVQSVGKGPGDDDGDDDEEGRAGANRGEGGQGEGRAPAARIDDRGAQGRRASGSQRSLSPKDIETMKACRLDPDNDRDVVQYMKEAEALEASA